MGSPLRLPHTSPTPKWRRHFGRSEATSETFEGGELLSPISLLSAASGSEAEGCRGYWVLRRQVFGHRLVYSINFRLLYANYVKAKLLQGKPATSGRDVHNEVSNYCFDRFIRFSAKHELV